MAKIYLAWNISNLGLQICLLFGFPSLCHMARYSIICFAPLNLSYKFEPNTLYLWIE